MNQSTYNSLKSFIWGIANDCLVDVYDVGDYRKIILPMFVIRRFDAVLEPKHEAVIKAKKEFTKAGITELDAALAAVAEQAFVNKSDFTLTDLKSRTNQQQLKKDFIEYLDGFSENVQVIINKFHIRNEIDRLSEQDRLGLLIEKFVDPRINLSNRPVLNEDGSVKIEALDNHTMGTLFEEVIRMFNEETNVTDAGRHFTPRDIVELIADLAFIPVQDKIQSTTYRIYDGACGTGGMLTVGDEHIKKLAREQGKKVSIHLYGQENADETYAIARADMLVKGEGKESDQIRFGSTISDDKFAKEEFDFMLSNPPFGTPWKTDLKAWGIGKKDEISEGSQEDINQLVGEAYLMRAYMHFILVNLYGQPYTATGALETKAVPLKLNTDLEEIPSRNTVKEIYTSILSDIETARKLINKNEWEIQYSYRFSTLSVDAMESRVYLYMGEWSKSYEASERVLAGKSTLVNLNDEGGKLPNEFTSVEMITAYEVFPNSDYAGSLLLYPSFLQEYEEGKDLRPNKYYQANKNGNYTSIKSGESKFKCTFRTGELYLNSAEAAAHLNKLPEARTRLLKLIENRYTSEGYEQKKNEINAMSQEKLVTEILKERARELAFEGHRWFDLRRTTRPEIKKEIEDVTYTLVQDDSRYTLRIPQDAIDANPGLLN